MAKQRINIPIYKRPLDFIFVGFALVNLLFVVYFVDAESLTVPDPNNIPETGFVWPPREVIKLVHWWGRTFDPLLLQRPPFWQMTIWIDVIFYGPFYAFAIYAFIKCKEWIRIPTIIYGTAISVCVLVILWEELYGVHQALDKTVVVGANLPYLLLPLIMVFRMSFSKHPFTQVVNHKKTQ